MSVRPWNSRADRRFRGWNAAASPRPSLRRYLARLREAEKFAEIDPELFVDFQATRPLVSLEEGQTRPIEWPENTFFRTRIPGPMRRRRPRRRRAELPLADLH